MSLNDAMYYYVKNLQGDITKMVNHQGEVMVEYTYDAWGNILKEKSNVIPSYATVREFNPEDMCMIQIQVCTISKVDTMTQKPVDLLMLMILHM